MKKRILSIVMAICLLLSCAPITAFAADTYDVFIGDVGFKSIIPPYLAFGAVAFSILVALASGIYPALRAMRLSPLTAIRND